MDLKKLDEVFRDKDHEWRIQRAGKKQNGDLWAIIVPYVTNRAIQSRLDEVCGKGRWKNEFRAGPDGGVICGISIFMDVPPGYEGEWVTKWDGAENTQIESVKGGLSDSMKRAGVQWGIGRYLYALTDTYWAEISDQGKHRTYVNIDGKKQEIRWDAPLISDLLKGSKFISDAQRKVLYETAKQSGWTDAEFKSYLKDQGYESSAKIPADAYEELHRVFEMGADFKDVKDDEIPEVA